MRETATQNRLLDPALIAQLQRVNGWRTMPELCGTCQRRHAVRLSGEGAHCASCPFPGDDAGLRARQARTAALQRRQASIIAALTAEAAGVNHRGLVGLVVPAGEVTQLAPGRFEVIEPYAFRDALRSGAAVPLLWGHADDEVRTEGGARLFETRGGLYFEAELPRGQADSIQQRITQRGASRVSIGFQTDEERTEPYRGGSLRRVLRAVPTHVALVNDPAYRSTWCAPRSPAAWARIYAGLRVDVQNL